MFHWFIYDYVINIMKKTSLTLSSEAKIINWTSIICPQNDVELITPEE